MRNAADVTAMRHAHANLPADPDELHLATAHPTDGRALRFHVDDFALEWIPTLAAALSESPQFAAAARTFDAELLTLHVENALHRQLLDVCRARVRRKYLQLAGRPCAKPVACPSELYDLVRSHWRDDSIAIVPRWDGRTLKRRLESASNRIRNAVMRRRSTAAHPGDRPMIAVEIVEGSDVAKKSEAFWLASGEIASGQVLFVFERRNKSFVDSAREFAHIRAIGAHAIALHPSVSAGGEIPVWIPPRMSASFAAYCRSIERGRTRASRWLAFNLREFGRAVWYWEALFRHFNVAAYQHFTELSMDIAPRRAAIDRLGGIEIGKMRSQFFDRSSAAFHFQHEVALVWHGSVADVLHHSRTRTRAVAPIGYPWDHLFSSMKNEGGDLRKQLLEHGASRVVAIFDNDAHVNGHFSDEDVHRLYSHLVGIVRADPTIALIVKSKKPRILERMPEIMAALRELEAAGRCVVVTRQLASIVPAALAADLVVAVPASTAGCEAALAGSNVLMYDPGGSINHALHGLEEPVIHTTFESFARALNEHLTKPSRPLPRSAEYAELLDPYRDGYAARRAARFIAAFVAAREQQRTKTAALDAALGGYLDRVAGCSP